MEDQYHPWTWCCESSKAHSALGYQKVVREAIVRQCDVITFCFWYCEIYVVELCQLFASDLYAELLEPTTQTGTVHDITMESLCNLQPYCVLRMKCSVPHDISIAYEQVALDEDILRYTESCSAVSDGYVCTGMYCYSFLPRIVWN